MPFSIKLEKRLQPSQTIAYLVPAASFVLALLFGAILLSLAGANPWQTYRAMLEGALGIFQPVFQIDAEDRTECRDREEECGQEIQPVCRHGHLLTGGGLFFRSPWSASCTRPTPCQTRPMLGRRSFGICSFRLL